MSFWSDLVGDLVKFGAFGALGDTAQETSQVVGGWGALAGVISGIWTELKDGRMWRSLGWLVLGVIVMLLSVLWWIGPSAGRASPIGLAAEGLS